MGRTDKLDLMQGTLDVMVLQTLAAMGPQHGYGLARRIEQRSGVRLQQRGWIEADWGTSEANRRAKFYAITKAGRKQLAEQKSYWARLSAVMGRVLSPAGGDAK